MKRFILILMIAVMVLSICACSNSSAKISAAEDPTAYFFKENNWSMEEVISKFGEFDKCEKNSFLFTDYLLYTSYSQPVFGREWEFQLFAMPGEDAEMITGAKFFFYQDEMSDKEFVKYRDEIVDYYTSAFGQPEVYNLSSGNPRWIWNFEDLELMFEDCRDSAGCMGMMVNKI